MALAAAVVLGVALAVVFAQSRWIEDALFPYAVVLQVTPVVAIAPLVIIWTKNDVVLALLVCAWIVAFFPILSNTILGLRNGRIIVLGDQSNGVNASRTPTKSATPTP